MKLKYSSNIYIYLFNYFMFFNYKKQNIFISFR